MLSGAQEVEIRRIVVRGQPGLLFMRSHLNQQKLDMVVCICNPSYAGSINKRIAV
jgi:hypothetical protein